MPCQHWLLPIDPRAHGAQQPSDWATRADATAVWRGIAQSQPIDRWCLRNGFRSMRRGDTIWAYLSRRQEVCALGRVRAVVPDGDGGWAVEIDWDDEATALLTRRPAPRADFRQVPMSTCRASVEARVALERHLEMLRRT